MVRYRYTGSGWYRGREYVGHGDEVSDVTEAELAAFGDSLDRVEATDDTDADSDGGGSGDADDDGVDAPFDPDEYTVSEFEDRVESGDYSDAELDALAEAEGPESGDGRAGVHEAIDEER